MAAGGKTRTLSAVVGNVDECVVLSGQSWVQVKYEAFGGTLTLKLEKTE